MNPWRGKHVVVIGGGDTGNDCLGTAMRHGAASVRQLEITPQLPPQRLAENPWPEYPMTAKIGYGQGRSCCGSTGTYVSQHFDNCFCRSGTGTGDWDRKQSK